MITLTDISAVVGGKKLFSGLRLTINSGDRIGIIGPNGAGKSTLLNIIAQTLDPSSGTVVHTSHERRAFVTQDFVLPEDSDATVYGYLEYHENTFSALARVGLEDDVVGLHPASLSGGQKTRLAFAKAMLESPTLLLLDEPTNHLDDEGVEWLIIFLRGFRGAVVMVSHDRYFLNALTTQIVEIDPANARVEMYTGSYDTYVAERDVRRAAWERRYNDQEKERRRLEQWLVLKRQEATVHPSPAKGRLIRHMEKRIEKELGGENKIARPMDGKAVRVNDPMGEVHRDKLMVRLTHVAKCVGDRELLRDVSLEVRGRDHVRIGGKNGSGKTTLLKLLLGETVADAGEVRIGNDVKIGYFSQEHDTLDPQLSVMEEFSRIDRRVNTVSSPRAVLGSFLFSGNDIEKRVRDLSPGERVRLMFAKLLQQRNEMLILDEPTNHLDIPSREVIEEALQHYQGAIIVVTHDRYFLDAIGIDAAYVIEDGMAVKM